MSLPLPLTLKVTLRDRLIRKWEVELKPPPFEFPPVILELTLHPPHLSVSASLPLPPLRPREGLWDPRADAVLSESLSPSAGFCPFPSGGHAHQHCVLLLPSAGGFLWPGRCSLLPQHRKPQVFSPKRQREIGFPGECQVCGFSIFTVLSLFTQFGFLLLLL